MGRHSKPTRKGKITAVVLTSSALALAPLVITAGTANAAEPAGPPGGWGPIIACESGGNPTVVNKTGESTASGLFQFLDGTWRDVGGTGRAKDASVAEQYKRAEMLYAQSGTTPWNASKSCWAGKTGEAKIKAAPKAKAKPAPKPAPNAKAKIVDNGRGTYVCTSDTLYFDACDSGTLGQRVAYPGRPEYSVVTHKGKTHVVKTGDTLSGIAAANSTTWQELFAKNKGTVKNPDLIFPSQALTL